MIVDLRFMERGKQALFLSYFKKRKIKSNKKKPKRPTGTDAKRVSTASLEIILS